MRHRPPLAGDFVVANGLPLARLYARFDAIAKGRVHGDSSAAHRSVIGRFAANQRLAEALGWTAFVLERRGESGRLELHGSPPGSHDHEIVPDRNTDSGVETPNESTEDGSLPPQVRGKIGGRLGSISWRSRMRWLDDGGR